MQAEELLPALRALRLIFVLRLTKSKDEETIIINRCGQSTYPKKNSVLTSGSTAVAVRTNDYLLRLLSNAS